MSFQLARYLATDISQRPEETKTNDIFYISNITHIGLEAIYYNGCGLINKGPSF